ncbi:hypothetical protein EVC35_06540 [Oenococcus sicerae]|uniref:Thoeris protein ThsB TIR-like domain-containing protein n=1 Tax=Oenococcus sicerae TaxID=2203724 RepID=A0AAJ1RAB2_9LACO|nr:hypothetical protein [Oenococcus sicerae]
MVKHQVFFSFEYNKDNWRASQVREMGAVSSSSTFSSNDWEEVKEKNDTAIKKWINDQMAMRACVVVLVGETTSSRKWVNYEIEHAMSLNKGIVGVYIHGLKDGSGNQTAEGANPFYNIKTINGDRLSKYVQCYDTPYSTSKYVYSDIEEHLPDLIDEAINNRFEY